MSIRLQPRPPVGAFSFLTVVIAALLLPIAILPITGCSTSPSAGSHVAGSESVEVRRIVSLAPNITEMLFALGLGDRVVGVTEFCNYPPEALRLPKVGGFVNPNAETILALRPDLVVATPNVGNRTFVERVMAVGARVEVVQARNVAEIFPAIEAIARAAGTEAAGRDLVARIRADLARQTSRVKGLPRRRTLFCLQIEPLVVAGPSSFPGDLVELAGGENIVPASAGAYPSFSLEAVVAAAPETIVQSLMDTRSGTTGEDSLLAYWRRFGSIPAVAKRSVFTVPGDVVLRPGPRLAEGVGALIDLIHPEARRGAVMEQPEALLRSAAKETGRRPSVHLAHNARMAQRSPTARVTHRRPQPPGCPPIRFKKVCRRAALRPSVQASFLLVELPVLHLNVQASRLHTPIRDPRMAPRPSTRIRSRFQERSLLAVEPGIHRLFSLPERKHRCSRGGE